MRKIDPVTVEGSEERARDRGDPGLIQIPDPEGNSLAVPSVVQRILWEHIADLVALRRRWRKAGNVMVIVGILGFLGSIGAAVAASFAMQGQPQPTDLSQVSPEELRASIIMTVVLVFSPMLMLIGILVRQKQ